MDAKVDTAKRPMERELVLTRIFDAPRELVFAAWTEPKHLAQWWGPKSFTNPVCEVDLRVGGALKIVMRAPDGAEHPMKGVFRDVTPPERLEFTNMAVDKDGATLLEGITTVTFAVLGDKTKVTLNTRMMGKVAIAAMMLEGMEMGWTQSLDRLGDYLSPEGKEARSMQINAHLNFNGTCEEAFKFYAQCFGGKIVTMMRYAGTPMAARMPADWQGKVIHAHMTIGDWVIMGADAPPDRYSKPQGFTMNVGPKTAEEAERVFAALSDHGSVQMPLQKTFWAERFGMVTDRFGIPWMVNL